MSRFIRITTENLVTIALNLDHVTSITLIDARPPMPMANVVLNDNSMISHIRLSDRLLDTPNAALNERDAQRAIDEFFAMVCAS